MWVLCVQFGLFHGDPHPGNVFALRDGRIAYVDFGNVAEVPPGLCSSYIHQQHFLGCASLLSGSCCGVYLITEVEVIHTRSQSFIDLLSTGLRVWVGLDSLLRLSGCAQVSQTNKQTLIDAVVHAVNEDYEEMAKDFIKLVRFYDGPCRTGPHVCVIRARSGREFGHRCMLSCRAVVREQWCVTHANRSVSDFAGCATLPIS